jgi:hypothetical protein
MEKKQTPKKNEEVGYRSRFIARRIPGRIFMLANQLYLVTGKPDFGKLLHCLNSITEIPEGGEEPGPIELGFDANNISIIDQEKLVSCSRALQKWRKVIGDEANSSRQKKKRKEKLEQWIKEVDQLAPELEAQWKIFRDWKKKRHFSGTPYIILREYSFQNQHLDKPLLNWMLHLVEWMAGDIARERLSVAMVNLEEKVIEYELILKGLESEVYLIQKISSKYSSEKNQAVKNLISKLPKRVEELLDIPVHGFDYDPNEILPIISQFKRNMSYSSIIGPIAALCASDESAVPIPEFLYTGGYAYDKTELYKVLVSESREKGYDELLKNLDLIDNLHNTGQQKFIAARMLLKNGNQAKHVSWLLAELDSYELKQFSAKELNPAKLFELFEFLNLLDINASLNQILKSILNRGSTDLVDILVEWIHALGMNFIDIGKGIWIWNSLQILLQLESNDPQYKARIQKWAYPPKFEINPKNNEYSELSRESIWWLNRLFYYQRMNGEEPGLTNTIRDLLFHSGKEQAQIDYLESIRGTELFSDQLAKRLEYLLGREPQRNQKVDERKTLKKIKEVCAHTALEALKSMIQAESNRVWTKYFDFDPPGHLSDMHIILICNWLVELPTTSKGKLEELIKSWQENGFYYRINLQLNQHWLNIAEKRGIIIKEWVNPEPMDSIIATQNIVIGTAPDPFCTFLMGSYFKTCLSLDDFNKNSVLANAYDLNKNVLFALDDKGNVLARKLVAINESMELIGYRTYKSESLVLSGSRRDELEDLIHAYCGRWAARICVNLGFTGQPENFSGLFWYDDGIELWNYEAQFAFNNALDPVKIIERDKFFINYKIDSLLAQNKEQYLKILSELGIKLPAYENNDLEGLIKTPDLVEEALAVVARKTNNYALADELFKYCTTESGRLEAITSMALIKGLDYIPSLLKIRNIGEVESKRTMEILYEFDHPDAAKTIIKCFIGEDSRYREIAWLYKFVFRNKKAADFFISEYIKNKGEFELYEIEILVILEIFLHKGWKIPDNFLNTSLFSDASNIQYTPISFLQWIPPLSKKLKLKELENIEMAEDEDYNHNSQSRLNKAILLALRNPGPESTKYLRSKATTSSEALLALSLRNADKYKSFIKKRVLKDFTDKIAIMALMISEGGEEATAILEHTFKEIPNLQTRVNEIKKDYDNLMLDQIVFISNRNYFPLLTERIWEFTSKLNEKSITLSYEIYLLEDKILEPNNAGRIGLVIKLARLLGEIAIEQSDNLEYIIEVHEALFYLLEKIPIYLIEEFIPLIDALSNYQVFNSHFASEEYAQDYMGSLQREWNMDHFFWPYYSFFDSDLEPREACYFFKPEYILGVISLPYDPNKSLKIIQFLSSRIENNLSKSEFDSILTGKTKLQQELISEHLAFTES